MERLTPLYDGVARWTAHIFQALLRWYIKMLLFLI